MANIRKPKWKVLGMMLLLFCVCTLLLGAGKRNQVNTIDIQALLYEDGSMYVIQHWNGEFSDGNELYIPLKLPPYMQVSQLKVSDKNGVYDTVQDWDVDASFTQKAQAAGVRETETGSEICFGISTYGANQYTIEYRMAQVVGQYTDGVSGANFRFVNSAMNTAPTRVTLTIRLANAVPLTEEVAKIWGFGYTGNLKFADGAIFAYTKEDLSQEEHMTLLMQFQEGLFTPERNVKGEFSTLQNATFEGQFHIDEREKITPWWVYAILPLVVLLLLVAVVYIFFMKEWRAKRAFVAFAKKQEYFKELPNDGRRHVSYALGKIFGLCNDSDILCVDILRLLDEGALKEDVEQKGFMTARIDDFNLALARPPQKGDNFDNALYTIVQIAAINDGKLDKDQIISYMESKYGNVRQYLDEIQQDGRDYLDDTTGEDDETPKGKQKKKHDPWTIPGRVQWLSPGMKFQLAELVGFYEYLNAFGNLKDDELTQNNFWKKILSYSVLFGMCEEVSEHMKRIYPDIAEAVAEYQNYVGYAHLYAKLYYNELRERELAEATEQKGKGKKKEKKSKKVKKSKKM